MREAFGRHGHSRAGEIQLVEKKGQTGGNIGGSLGKSLSAFILKSCGYLRQLIGTYCFGKGFKAVGSSCKGAKVLLLKEGGKQGMRNFTYKDFPCIRLQPD